jgi:hypothetical protein
MAAVWRAAAKIIQQSCCDLIGERHNDRGADLRPRDLNNPGPPGYAIQIKAGYLGDTQPVAGNQ